MSTLITYKIVSDVNGRLKSAARTACSFWNRFIQPQSSIVIRIGTFTSFGTTIARAYQPYRQGEVVYGVVEFNTNFLPGFSGTEVAGTVAHELGHTLGIGWEKWMTLFDPEAGLFTAESIKSLPALKRMRVETDYGPGTTLSHWDEATFGAELMTGLKGGAEHVLPVTIDVVGLLGHKVNERLKKQTPLDALLTQVAAIQFAQKDTAKALNLDHFVVTPIWEESYDFGRRKKPLAS